jgi:gamma-glutamyl phosphate reductase
LIINSNIPNLLLENLFDKLNKSGINIIKEQENLDYFKEQLSLDLNIKFVNNIEEAINHIDTYSSLHSD